MKLQTIEPELLVSPADTDRVAQLNRFRLRDEDWVHLSGVAAQEGVIFLSTPFSLPAVVMLDPLVAAYKVASGDNDLYALLEAVAATAKPVVLSTGMADINDTACFISPSVSIRWICSLACFGFMFSKMIRAFSKFAAIDPSRRFLSRTSKSVCTF